MNLGPWHLHLRQRLGALEPFPATDAAKRTLDHIIYWVSFIQPFALLPQVAAVYFDGAAEGVSPTTWFLLAFFNTLWIAYGIVHREKPIIITHVLFTVLNLSIAIGAL